MDILQPNTCENWAESQKKCGAAVPATDREFARIQFLNSTHPRVLDGPRAKTKSAAKTNRSKFHPTMTLSRHIARLRSISERVDSMDGSVALLARSSVELDSLHVTEISSCSFDSDASLDRILDGAIFLQRRLATRKSVLETLNEAPMLPRNQWLQCKVHLREACCLEENLVELITLLENMREQQILFGSPKNMCIFPFFFLLTLFCCFEKDHVTTTCVQRRRQSLCGINLDSKCQPLSATQS